MHAGAPVYGTTQPLGLSMRQLCRPIATETAAHAGDPLAVDIGAAFEIVHRRRKSSLGPRIAAKTRVFPSARHVDGKAGKAILEQDVIVGAPIFFPAVDAAPVHHDWRALDAFGNL